ncbi:hypothetical protein [Caballeronia sp. LZ034LL]|uniref:hypothetical protein n=1 Tax=Caballeronia sp. LZ034LL TaxID=3038567 RepID=UPI0028544960|nr:hypothetical protein [Caballeronia sp. LZ034LL]MDR5839375.1 hypothetical protein [Caballeronia sp. LZ034LL]
MEDAYVCTPRNLRTFIADALEAGLVPFVTASPGVGKSSIMKLVAKDLNLQVIDHRLSTSAPEDLSGLPRFDEAGQARFAPFADLFPLKNTPLPKNRDGWMLFLDEFNSAAKSVQAAAYKLVLDRQVGQHDLHDNCVITAAGNKATDRAIVNQISTAMQSRVVHLELEVNFEEWLYDVAFAQQYDARIIGFLSQFPSKLMDFDPAHKEKTFACPRTWEFVNRLCKLDHWQGDLTDKAPLLTGALTSGIATEFIVFSKVWKELVKIDQVIKDPKSTPIPASPSAKWATIAHLMEHINELNFDDVATYVNRQDFGVSFRILFFRSVMHRQPNMRTHPAFAKAMAELSKYLQP